MDDDLENEVDMSTVYKQAANNLTTIKNFNDSLNRFGYTKDDRIDRRDMVLMYQTIHGEMSNEITSLAHSNSYSNAKEMRNNLNSIKQEFLNLQITNDQNRRNEQEEIFRKTQESFLNEIKLRHANEEREVLRKCQNLKENLLKTHEIEIENLELKIKKIKKLPVVYSKKLIGNLPSIPPSLPPHRPYLELLKSESSLINLNEYDEARKVRNRIDQILPNEISQSDQNFSLRNQMKREALARSHCDDLARLDEKIKGIIWTDKRRREREYARYPSFPPS
jgi:hypothetical protein